MENKEISDILSDVADLMELHGINEFKTRSIRNAAFSIKRMIEPLGSVPLDKLEEIPGIGKSIGKKIGEILSTGSLAERDVFLKDTPSGLLEMMDIKGLGPKKVARLWKELGIESTGELLYACNENRLITLKGFGDKTQDQVRKMLEFTIGNRGWYHYAALEKPALMGLDFFRKSDLFDQVEITGPMRRNCEVVQSINYIAVSRKNPDELVKSLAKGTPFGDAELKLEGQLIHFSGSMGIPVSIRLTESERFAFDWLISTGSEAHVETLSKQTGWDESKLVTCNSEAFIYKQIGLSFIPPELREGHGEILKAASNSIPELVALKDLKGCLHNHSTWSDGIHSLREMAVACKNLGLEYFGICDHSKSAFYANGMSADRVREQQLEITRLNQELAPFKIFSGIESDILNDGSLDYDDEVLRSFDFVVASVHSGLRMTEQRATERLLRAIENPFTTILGHPTGRLLLSREGYPIDHRAIIDACAKHEVVIELNAHPYRLDLDWRWISYARERGVLISINPDAHQVLGLNDMHFGICVARKGMLTPDGTFNALSLTEITGWFEKRKKMVASA